jgi:hypothetical protein
MWSKRKLRQAIHRYLIDSFRRESPPRVSELATILGVSRLALSQLSNTFFGCPPGVYLRSIRRTYAQRLLRRTTLSTSKVAYRSGYGHGDRSSARSAESSGTHHVEGQPAGGRRMLPLTERTNALREVTRLLLALLDRCRRSRTGFAVLCRRVCDRPRRAGARD